jgi:EAL domain-containing protein (putative c-di-GMP-specific phosphodiesterase class I)
MPKPDPDSEPTALRHGVYTLRSAFQPIFSFSHQRLIGHEALLRATDESGRALSPQRMFDSCSGVDAVRALDSACHLLHASGFARGLDPAQWLFLNVDASAFDATSDVATTTAGIRDVAARSGLHPTQIVIELLETALPDGPAFESWVGALKDLGFIIALDDFGAGHSNFDRVFRLRPHIVKLDRNVIARAALDKTVWRVMTQMISLLHECGTQVLIEGVESSAEADIALDSDADFVQGYHFGRPQPALQRLHDASPSMIDVWARTNERSLSASQAHERQVRPYAEALMHAKGRLEAGRPMEEACAAFLGLPDADLCYMLDGDGMQVGPRLFREVQPVGGVIGDPFAPLHDVRGARWSRRPYFRRAMAAPGELQLTRPYPTMHSRRMNVTLSVCFMLRGTRLVLCGDKLWHLTDERPWQGGTPSGGRTSLATTADAHNAGRLGDRTPGKSNVDEPAAGATASLSIRA